MNTTSLTETFGSSFTVLDTTIRDGQMTPLHVHAADEILSVLEGEIVVHVKGRSTTLGPGASLTAPAGVPHAVAGSSSRARYLSATSTPSAERYADFLRAVAAPDVAPVESDDEDSVVAALAEASGITVLAPPGTLP